MTDGLWRMADGSKITSSCRSDIEVALIPMRVRAAIVCRPRDANLVKRSEQYHRSSPFNPMNSFFRRDESDDTYQSPVDITAVSGFIENWISKCDSLPAVQLSHSTSTH